MTSLSRFEEPWAGAVKSQQPSGGSEFPDYPQSKPESLISTSCPQSFQTGTGASIYTQSLLPAILKAKYEVILVTCFWAPSTTLTALKETLEELALLRRERILYQHVAGPDGEIVSPLRIRICFSSRSFFQKLFHPSSRDGFVYPPSSWPTQLGLPSHDTLESGLIDLQAKSLFFLPFSVMHPKFLIVDRQRAWLPSCNVSWEPWLEGCVEITGNTVSDLMMFYQSVWETRPSAEAGNPSRSPGFQLGSAHQRPPRPSSVGLTSIKSPASYFVPLGDEVAVSTILLPSSHHRNPKFRPLPWHRSPSPPRTPLNCAILRLLEMAESSIYIQTPNLTSAAVIDAVLGALDRGVDVVIVTSKGMMLLEQIITAGTTTSLCLKSFMRQYRKRQSYQARWEHTQSSGDSGLAIDLEAQQPRLGSLKISYFHPHPTHQSKGVEEEPVHSHLKLTIVDDQYTILGSGNMDRASWFTSQELGILFQSITFAKAVREAVTEALNGRLNPIFDSTFSRQRLSTAS
ncbi:hypothetical protein F5X99DRAFT_274711 [Biscogniauxia marginata]|nr:hypothetical protein F5X99DRAFT_274711 [Biscogniauxia marginata]